MLALPLLTKPLLPNIMRARSWRSIGINREMTTKILLDGMRFPSGLLIPITSCCTHHVTQAVLSSTRLAWEFQYWLGVTRSLFAICWATNWKRLSFPERQFQSSERLSSEE